MQKREVMEVREAVMAELGWENVRKVLEQKLRASFSIAQWKEQLHLYQLVLPMLVHYKNRKT